MIGTEIASIWYRRHTPIARHGHSGTSLSSPWQNGFAERLIRSLRRECLDHIIVLGEDICTGF